PPQIVIQTEAPGYSPEQVEQLVTRPIEASVSGVAGLATLRSQSIQGLSVITLFFGDASDIYRDRQMTGERLTDAARSLPTGVKAPAMTPLTSSTSLVLLAGLLSESLDPMDLRSFAEFELKPRLLAVPGVSKV
ncbi:efflux RND transporter permease subunit, partial [Staphylococcus epidermidis]|uniref:efflux RND transporter permease subunit n=1 Tax=Staphylococcus epidermidis TaxID=1282 RepID=UPI00273A3DAD